MPKAKSSNADFWIASLSFIACGRPYPFRIVERNTKDKPTVQSHYTPIVNEVIQCQLTVRLICADSKERHRLMGLASTGHTNGCEVCLAESKRKTVDGKKHVTFGYR